MFFLAFSQEEAQAGREKLMADMLDKGFLEVQTPLKRHTMQGQPIEAREATLWAVEAPTGENLHAGVILLHPLPAATLGCPILGNADANLFWS